MTKRVWSTIAYVVMAALGLILAVMVREAWPALALLFGVPSGIALGFAAGPWVFNDPDLET